MVHVRHSQPSIGAGWSPGTLRGSDAMPPPRSFVALHRRRSCGGEEDVGGSATLDRSPDVLGTLPTRSASRGALTAQKSALDDGAVLHACSADCATPSAASSLESQHPQSHAWRSWRSAKLCTFFASPAPAEAYVTRTEKDETQKSYLYTRFTFCRMPLLRSRSPHCVAP